MSFLPVKSSAVDLVNLWALGSWLSLDYSMVSLVRYLNVDPPPLHPPYIIHVISVPRPSPFFRHSSTCVYYTEHKPRTNKKKRGRPGNEANILSQCHPFPLGCWLVIKLRTALGHLSQTQDLFITHTHTYSHTNDIKNCTEAQYMQPRCQSGHLHLKDSNFWNSRRSHQKSRSRVYNNVKLIRS